MESTADGGDDFLREHAQAAPVPGIVVLMQAAEPSVGTIAITRAASGVELGRGVPHGLFADDAQVSRGHVRVAIQSGVENAIDSTEVRFDVEDLGSRNGTFLNGVRLTGVATQAAPALLRIGRSLLWLVADIRPFTGQQKHAHQAQQGPVMGGLTRRALGEIALASKSGDTLLVLGESGSGKEGMARAFHEAQYGQNSRAPFIAVNCAAIPEGLAERLLFGAKRGAFSGATDADGYILEAHGGTLFLDEIAELDPLVQAKLLRVLETREVVALGSVAPRKVQIRICAATHKDLRNEVSAGRFRADLYYRVGRPEVRVPPLRERLDEIPWLLARVCQSVAPQLQAAVATVEACALRHWPGNVRELLTEARRAAHAALAEGSDVLRPDHFSADAGQPLAPTSIDSPQSPQSAQPESSKSASALDDAAIEAALAEHAGNVSRAAKALGLHRNQLRRWVSKHQPTTQPPEADDE